MDDPCCSQQREVWYCMLGIGPLRPNRSLLDQWLRRWVSQVDMLETKGAREACQFQPRIVTVYPRTPSADAQLLLWIWRYAAPITGAASRSDTHLGNKFCTQERVQPLDAARKQTSVHPSAVRFNCLTSGVF